MARTVIADLQAELAALAAVLGKRIQGVRDFLALGMTVLDDSVRTKAQDSLRRAEFRASLMASLLRDAESLLADGYPDMDHLFLVMDAGELGELTAQWESMGAALAEFQRAAGASPSPASALDPTVQVVAQP